SIQLRPAARRPESPRACGAGEGGGVGEPGVDSALLAHRAGDFAGAEGGGLGRESRGAAGEGFGGGVPGDGRVFTSESAADAEFLRHMETGRDCATACGTNDRANCRTGRATIAKSSWQEC